MYTAVQSISKGQESRQGMGERGLTCVHAHSRAINLKNMDNGNFTAPCHNPWGVLFQRGGVGWLLIATA